MAWSRLDDNLLTHPLMARLLESAEFNHSLKNEAFGVVAQLLTASAAHLTDYVVEYGQVAQVAPGRETIIIDTLVNAGILFRIEADGRKLLKIVEDEEFLHNRTRAEVMIDRNRAADKRNPDLIYPVRVRDSDICRWCGKTVNWRDRRSGRAATYDSLVGHEKSTPDTLVVACKTCNSRRKGGVVLELRDPPSKEGLYYTKETVALINGSDWARDNGVHLSVSQPELDFISTADPRQQQVGGQAAAGDGRAAPATHRAAPGEAVGFSDSMEDAPDWVKEALIDVEAPSRQQQVGGQAAAGDGRAAPATHRAAPDVEAPRSNDESETSEPSTFDTHQSDSDQYADSVEAPLRQQQVGGQAAAGDGRAAPATHRAAPDVEAPQPHGDVGSGMDVDSRPGSRHRSSSGSRSELDRVGDGTGNVGSGRVGYGLAGKARRRRRGHRGRNRG